MMFDPGNNAPLMRDCCLDKCDQFDLGAFLTNRNAPRVHCRPAGNELKPTLVRHPWRLGKPRLRPVQIFNIA